MAHKNQNTGHSDRPAQNIPKIQSPDGPHVSLARFGGEPLEGSGFEAEIPEPESEWRDPR